MFYKGICFMSFFPFAFIYTRNEHILQCGLQCGLQNDIHIISDEVSLQPKNLGDVF